MLPRGRRMGETNRSPHIFRTRSEDQFVSSKNQSELGRDRSSRKPVLPISFTMTRHQARSRVLCGLVSRARPRAPVVSSWINLFSWFSVGLAPPIGRVARERFDTVTTPQGSIAQDAPPARPVRGPMSVPLGRFEPPPGDDHGFAARGFWASGAIAQE